MSDQNLPHLSFITTADGSQTLFNSVVGENYHSRHGALQESKHVFLASGLKYYISASGAAKASVLEVGFGTGLNFLVTAEYTSQNSLDLCYVGIEAYPLSYQLISQTLYEQYVSQPLWNDFLSKYPQALSSEVRINDSTFLKIANSKLLDFKSEEQFDVIYFDAFAAIHQPEMWSRQSLSYLSQFLKPGGIFVTYAITGDLKRTMKELGFSIEKIAGAPGKREMLRATKNK